MVLCEHFEDAIESIQLRWDCHFYYKTTKKGEIFKISYHKNSNTVFEYKFLSYLNNDFRLVHKFTKNTAKEVLSILQSWYKDNKNNIEILDKSKVKLLKMNYKLDESNSCWKNMKGLKKAIENGLEVPNCIPDSDYQLNEVEIFINRKNRELTSKYKKAIDWLDGVIADGDKDYAAKMLQIIEKWKKNYEDKIRSAKTVLKESIKNSYEELYEIQIDDYIKKAERQYNYYLDHLETNFEGKYKEQQLNHLHQWYNQTMNYLESRKEDLKKTNVSEKEFKVFYRPFGYLDLDEAVKIVDIQKILSESKSVQQQIKSYIDDEKKLKKALKAFDKEDDKTRKFDNKSLDEKQKILKSFYEKHISKRKINENSEYFLDDNTDVNFYNDILNKPEYMFWHKGLIGKLKYMTPMEYFAKCAKMQGTTVEEQFRYIDKERAKEYKEKMLDSKKFPMLIVDYKDKTQEGRHRAYAANEIDPEIKIPVLSVFDRNEDRLFIARQVADKNISYEEFADWCKYFGVPYNELYYNKCKNKILN